MRDRDGRKVRVEAAIERAISEQRLVGVQVLIAEGGHEVSRHMAGFADREAGREMRDTDVFRLASLSKTVVSAAAMALMERGALGLEDPASRFAPLFRPRLADGDEPSITIRHLLTHTAGLDYGFMQPPDGPYQRAGVGDGIVDRGISMPDQLTRLSSVPLSNPPGSAWGYSVAIDVLGAVIERVTGRPLPEAVQDLVLRPLEMHDTGFRVSDPERMVVPYGDASPPQRMGDPQSIAFGPMLLGFSPGRIFDDSAFPSGGAGMVGTAVDYLRFLECLRLGGAPILRRDTVGMMMSNQIGELRVNFEATPSYGFGFGGSVLLDPSLAGTPQSAGTYSWGGVYGNHWFIDPARELSVLCLSNTAVEGMAGAFVGELRAAVYGC